LTYFSWLEDIRLTNGQAATDANGVTLLVPCERAAVAGDAAQSAASRELRKRAQLESKRLPPNQPTRAPSPPGGCRY
jgi:hypothetical protein